MGRSSFVDIDGFADDALVAPVLHDGCADRDGRETAAGDEVGLACKGSAKSGPQGRRLLCSEAGGINSTTPFVVPARPMAADRRRRHGPGVPRIADGDIQDARHPATPMVLSDNKGNRSSSRRSATAGRSGSRGQPSNGRFGTGRVLSDDRRGREGVGDPQHAGLARNRGRSCRGARSPMPIRSRPSAPRWPRSSSTAVVKDVAAPHGRRLRSRRRRHRGARRASRPSTALAFQNEFLFAERDGQAVEPRPT